MQRTDRQHVKLANEWLKEQQDQAGVTIRRQTFRNAAGEECLQVTARYDWQHWLVEAGFVPVRNDLNLGRRHRWFYQDAVDATPQQIVDSEANNRCVNVWMSDDLLQAVVAVEFYEWGHDERETYREVFVTMPDAVMHAIEIANTPGRID